MVTAAVFMRGWDFSRVVEQSRCSVAMLVWCTDSSCKAQTDQYVALGGMCMQSEQRMERDDMGITVS